jgi:hypothetical protein
MDQEHRVRVTWSPEQQQRGLPGVRATTDPVWPADTTPGGEAWSLALRFDRTPREQGNPSEGYAHFAFDNAPEGWLSAGRVLHLFERATGKYARVEVLAELHGAV